MNWNAKTAPLPVLVPQDIAALGRIEKAAGIIREARRDIVLDRMAARTPGEQLAWAAYMDTMLELTSVLEVRR